MVLALAAVVLTARVSVEFDSPCVFLNHGVQSHRFADPAAAVPMMEQAMQHVAAALRSLPQAMANGTATDVWALAQQSAAYVQQHPCALNSSVPPLPVRPFFSCIEGPLQSPATHHAVYESALCRVLRVDVPPGQMEPFHAHGRFHIMLEQGPLWGLNYRDETNATVFSRPALGPGALPHTRVQWMDPEWIHSVENTESVPNTGWTYLIEVKDLAELAMG